MIVFYNDLNRLVAKTAHTIIKNNIGIFVQSKIELLGNDKHSKAFSFGLWPHSLQFFALPFVLLAPVAWVHL